MRVLTIQSGDLVIVERTMADKTRCNYPHAISVYRRLFADYNAQKKTSYESFFWAFSDLRTKNLTEAIYRALEMVGKSTDTNGTDKIYVLDVPEELCLETDFYNFTDEIYACEHPEELQSIWNSIYEKRKSERQVIFPYIEESMVMMVIDLKDFAAPFEEIRREKMMQIQNVLKKGGY